MAEYKSISELDSMLRYVSADGWDADRVRQLREFLRMTQGAFAAHLGMRQQRVSEWECGKHEPRGASRVLLSALAAECGFVPGGRTLSDRALPSGASGGTRT